MIPSDFACKADWPFSLMTSKNSITVLLLEGAEKWNNGELVPQTEFTH